MIDWSKFDDCPESTCECLCGSTFRSHAKYHYAEAGAGLVARKPCPSCGEICNLRTVRSDPETFTIRK